MIKILLKHFTVLLGAALFMPILSILLHYLNVLPQRTTECHLQPAIFDGLVSGFLLLAFVLSCSILFAGITVFVKLQGTKKTKKKKTAGKLLMYGLLGILTIAISFYIFGGFSVGWYGLSNYC